MYYPQMVRLDAKFMRAGDVLHGIPGDRLERTISSVSTRSDGLMDIRFADGSETLTQANSTFSLETFTVPLAERTGPST